MASVAALLKSAERQRVQNQSPQRARVVRWFRASADTGVDVVPGVWQRYVEWESQGPFDEQILRDVDRTFPHEALFQGDDGRRRLYVASQRRRS